jgi:hypothetical protein
LQGLISYFVGLPTWNTNLILKILSCVYIDSLCILLAKSGESYSLCQFNCSQTPKLTKVPFRMFLDFGRYLLKSTTILEHIFQNASIDLFRIISFKTNMNFRTYLPKCLFQILSSKIYWNFKMYLLKHFYWLVSDPIFQH